MNLTIIYNYKLGVIDKDLLETQSLKNDNHNRTTLECRSITRAMFIPQCHLSLWIAFSCHYIFPYWTFVEICGTSCYMCGVGREFCSAPPTLTYKWFQRNKKRGLWNWNSYSTDDLYFSQISYLMSRYKKSNWFHLTTQVETRYEDHCRVSPCQEEIILIILAVCCDMVCTALD